ncbi:hypothetical protein [Roseimicrobium sp. ORNL1]|uniref:hypothetical protein n=1 Tax=Roseimicrobium sp. ORNL1 TaxID=2711231 RepID=UPI0013E0EAB3|nr:hypothetical protein [Roseimicrobium sp. ORNL1]QIF01982.1 hypothetical protein G5S37_10715 [Roseimicrobium sp. ORNL1]
MPRRTPLLILITLLVLLATPAIYVACTWSTENPLRFEAVRLEMEPSRGVKEVGILHLTVRNVSKLPVYLTFAGLKQKNASGASAAFQVVGGIVPRLQDRPGDPSSALYLPPGGSMQCRAYIVVQDVHSPKALQDIDVNYHWRSGTGEKAHTFWAQHIYQTTDWLEKLIPAPDLQRHRSPLTLPATASPQPSPGQGSGK